MISGILALVVVGAAGTWADLAPVSRLACEGPDVDPFVTDLRDRVLRYNGLAHWLIEAQGQPLTCEGSVTSEFDGALFGTVTLGFPDGTTLQIETMPPEISLVSVGNVSGFTDEEALRRVVETYTSDGGLDIDWSTPEVSDGPDGRVETYWDPTPGLNASVAFTYIDGVLVSVRVGMAP